MRVRKSLAAAVSPSAPNLSPSRDLRPLLGFIAVAVAYVACLIRLVGFAQDCAVDLLFDDLWDALTPLFKGEGPLQAFLYQHGPPRMGLGGLLEYFLYRATHWDVRAVSWAAVVVLAFAGIAAVFLATRLRGNLRWTDLGFPLLILTPIHWESMTLTPSLAAMILPLFLTIGSALAWSVNDKRVQSLAVITLGALNLFTGYGVCSGPVLFMLAALILIRPTRSHARVGRRTAIAILCGMFASAALYAHGYEWMPAVPGWKFPVSNWWDYPRFVALMFTSLAGLRSLSASAHLVGALLLCLTLFVFTRASLNLWRSRDTPRDLAVWVLTGTSLSYGAMTAVGRLPVSIEGAFMFRYATLMTPAIIGLGLAADEWTSDLSLKRFLPCAWVALTVVMWSNFAPERHGQAIAVAKTKWISSYLATHDLKAANAASNFWVYYPAPESPMIQQRLRWLEENHLSFFRSTPQR